MFFFPLLSFSPFHTFSSSDLPLLCCVLCVRDENVRVFWLVYYAAFWYRVLCSVSLSPTQTSCPRALELFGCIRERSRRRRCMRLGWCCFFLFFSGDSSKSQAAQAEAVEWFEVIKKKKENFSVLFHLHSTTYFLLSARSWIDIDIIKLCVLFACRTLVFNHRTTLLSLSGLSKENYTFRHEVTGNFSSSSHNIFFFR